MIHQNKSVVWVCAELVFCSFFSDSMHDTMHVSLSFLFYCTLCAKDIICMYAYFQNKNQRITSMITCWMYHLYKKVWLIIFFVNIEVKYFVISCALYNVWWLLNTDRKWFIDCFIYSQIIFAKLFQKQPPLNWWKNKRKKWWNIKHTKV